MNANEWIYSNVGGVVAGVESNPTQEIVCYVKGNLVTPKSSEALCHESIFTRSFNEQNEL
jgi:hypothetical protein